MLAELLRADSGVESVVVPTSADEMLAIIEHRQFDLHLVGGGSIDFHRNVRSRALEEGRTFQPSREIALMLNEPDPYRVLLARRWGATRVLDMRRPLDQVVQRILAEPGSPLWNEEEIGHFSIDGLPGSPTLEMICRDEVDFSIMEGIIEGLSDPEIAQRVNYAVQSVRNRVSRILVASHSRNRTHFAVRMVRPSKIVPTGT